jgi:hypothetical protein
VLLQETYYSIGGGFVMTEAELAAGKATDEGPPVPYPFKSATEMLDMAERSGKTIAELKRANEISRRGHDGLRSGVARIWQVMNDCIERGLEAEGTLPGGLGVTRRASGRAGHQPHRAAQDQRLDERLCHGRQRRERGRRSGRHRAHQWRGRRGACGDPLLARPCARRA